MKMKKYFSIVLSGLLILCALPAWGDTTQVSIQNFAFDPPSVTIKVGSTVTWTNNQDGVPHTSTEDVEGGWNSGRLESGQSFTTNPFNSPGTFTYHCDIHRSMKGTVIVVK